MEKVYNSDGTFYFSKQDNNVEVVTANKTLTTWYVESSTGIWASEE